MKNLIIKWVKDLKRHQRRYTRGKYESEKILTMTLLGNFRLKQQ